MWNASEDVHLALDPGLVGEAVQYFQSLDPAERYATINANPSLEIHNLEDTWTSRKHVLTKDLLFGCHPLSLEACRAHGNGGCALGEIDQILRLLTDYTDHIGKDRAQSCETLIAMACETSPGAPQQIYLQLMVDTHYKPKHQFFVAAVPPGKDRSFMACEFPFNATLASGLPCMETCGLELQSIQFESSWDLALALARTQCKWHLHPVRFRWCSGTNLLELEVLGFESEFVVRTRPRRVAADKTDLSFILSPDPWTGVSDDSAGRAASSCSGDAERFDEFDALLLDDVSDEEGALSDLEGGSNGGEDSADDSADETGGCDWPSDVPLCDGAEAGIEEGTEEAMHADTVALRAALGVPQPDTPQKPDMPPPSGAAASSDDALAFAPPIVGSAPVARVPPKANQVYLRGKLFTKLTRNQQWAGYSRTCPLCNVTRDLTFWKSGMAEEEALTRLERWGAACSGVATHRDLGGRLLIGFAT